MTSRTAAELRRRLEEQPNGCPVCGVVTRAMEAHVDSLFYELVNDPPIREAIRKAGGFCRPHARLVAKQADALGTSLIFSDVLRNELRGIDDGQFDRPPNTVGGVSRILDGSLPGRTPCPICREERGQEELAVDSLLEGIRDADLAEAFGGSSGLCLPHFRLAFLRCRDPVAWHRVLQTERGALSTLATELEELSRKFDYRYANAVIGEEGDSWRRALEVTSGRLDFE